MDYFNPAPLPPQLSQMLNTVGALMGGPYTVQDGGANPLSAAPTIGVPAGTVVGIADLGGCGPNATPGYGLAHWTGVEWRRISPGVQATMDPAATINLDYWKDPTRVKLTGTTLVTTRILLQNAKLNHKVAIYKPGILATLQAFAINLGGLASATDLTLTGNGLGLYEVLAGNSLSAVST